MATPSVTCYPQPGKDKSRRICEAFARGAGGVVDTSGQLKPGPAAFFGVTGLEALFREARSAGDWYYLDNAYFDKVRGLQFRAAKNALQAAGKPAWEKFAALSLGLQPWQQGGKHIVVVEQSDHFMREVAGWEGGAVGWREHVLQRLKPHTERPIMVRHWNRDKAVLVRNLHEDLKGAWALVTHTSAAAIGALVAGVPVFVTGPCPALEVGSAELEQIEKPRRPRGMYDFLATLVGAQWTLEEMAHGDTWRALNAT